MPEIAYKDLDDYLRNSKTPDQVFLIYGDSFLSDESASKIISFLFKSKDPGMNLEKADGLSSQSVGSAIEFLMTRSFFSGPKAVLISDARIFDSKTDIKSLLSKAQQAFDKDDPKKAAKFLLKYISETGIDISTLTSSNYIEMLNLSSDDEWVWQLVVYAKENSITSEEGQGESALIEKAIELGLPKNHNLILVTDSVDRKKSSYKTFEKKALVINCQIPKGDRKADREVQDSIFREMAATFLGALNKSLEPQAFAALRDMTGDDLRLFSANLELLSGYAGERQKITRDDVNKVLTRTKQDPIYEFTNSLSARDLESSLFYLRSLLDSGAHPLQIMASMINLVRRLLLIRSFCESEKGKAWRTGMSYNDFQNKVMPFVTASDTELTDTLASWTILKSPKGGKKAAKTDLLMAKGSSPYPLFLLFQKVTNMSMNDLLGHFEDLAKFDIKMKTSAGDAVLLLENFIIKFCTNNKR